jgi:hypothetical protein
MERTSGPNSDGDVAVQIWLAVLGLGPGPPPTYVVYKAE